jgi:hypothetical protein
MPKTCVILPLLSPLVLSSAPVAPSHWTPSVDLFFAGLWYLPSVTAVLNFCSAYVLNCSRDSIGRRGQALDGAPGGIPVDGVVTEPTIDSYSEFSVRKSY